MKKFYLNNEDVTDLVVGIPSLSIHAGDYGQVTIAPTPTITGLNTKGIWSAQLPHSPLYGGSPTPLPVRIEDEGITLFEGVLTGAIADEMSGTAQLLLQGTLQDALDSGCVYVSSAPETPSTVFNNLCTLYGIQVDTAILAQSEALYSSNGLTVVVTQPLPTGSLLDMFTALAEIGCARVFETTDGLAFDAFQIKTDTTPVYTFTNVPSGRITLWSAPEVELLQKETTDGYAVDWGSGYVTFPDSIEGLAVKQISGGLDALVTIYSLVGADFVGQQWYKYLTRTQAKVRFRCPVAYAAALPIGAYVHVYDKRWDVTTRIDISDIEFDGSAAATISGVTR